MDYSSGSMFISVLINTFSNLFHFYSIELSQEKTKTEPPVIQSQDIIVRETPEGAASVNRGKILPELKKTHGADFTSLACLSSEISSHSRNRQKDSQQLGSIKNYFHATAKKRYINAFSDLSLKG